MTTEPAGEAPVDRPVGRLAPERAEDGTPICPWCEQPVWDYCRSQYDTMTCVWRESDPEATAVPLYTWAAVEAEREDIAQWLEGQGQPGYAHEVRFRA